MIGSDRSSSVATDKEIEAGAKAIVRDLSLPGGRRKKLARVVEDHLGWFATVGARGMTWVDIAQVLSAAGATGQNGRTISVGTLSSTVWRKRESAKHRSKLNSVTALQNSSSTVPNPNDRAMSNGRKAGASRLPSRLFPSSPGEEPERRSRDTGKKQVKAPHGHPTAHSRSSTLQKPSSANDLLAFMQRSTAVRGVKRER
jgi:hypothetical protein